MKAFASALVLLFVVLGAHAARVPYPNTPIRESTDPAKVAAVERHAAQLRARDQAVFGSGTSARTDMSSGQTRSRGRRDRH
jgi:hypothetical protein